MRDRGAAVLGEELDSVPKRVLGSARGAPAGTASEVLLAEAGGTAEPSGPPADLLSQRFGPPLSSLCQCVQ